MNGVLSVILFVVMLPFVAAALYLALLAGLALLPYRARRARPQRLRRFAILIPARNEAARIPALAGSIRAIDYPPSLLSVLVVADNCEDTTAQVARDAGLSVCERHDTEHVGKGYAIAYGLDRLGTEHDAVVFIDGDCVVSRNILPAFNAHLERGEEAVQAYYTMETDTASRSAAARGLALALVHLVRPLAKQRIGASAGLKGSGMCLSTRVVDAVGWEVFGLAEDIEQHLRLLRLGVRVGFARDAVVTGAAPRALAGARAQHRRWEAGRLAAARAHALPLLREGLRSHSIARIDAAVELLVPPLSVLGAALLALLAGGLALGSSPVAVGAAAGIIGLVIYVSAGLVLQGRGWRATLTGALSIPFYALWKLGVYAQTLVARPRRWEPTKRDPSDERASEDLA